MYAEILSQLESDERYVSKQVLKMFRVAEGVEDAIRKSNLNSAGTSGSLSVGSYPLYSGSGVSAIVTESMSAQSDGEQSSVLLVGRAESFGRSEGSRNRSSSSAVPLLSVNSSDVLDLTAMTEIGVHTNTISHHQKLSLDTAAVTDITGNMNVQKSRLAAIASAPLHVTPSHHSAVSNNLSSSSVAETVKVKHAADREVIICEVMMAKCPLANEVRTLYHNLIGKCFSHEIFYS